MKAPSFFQCLMDYIFKKVLFVREYMENLLTFSATLEDHVEHVEFFLGWIKHHGLKYIKIISDSYVFVNSRYSMKLSTVIELWWTRKKFPR